MQTILLLAEVSVVEVDRAKKKEPERMLADFTLYVRAIKDMIGGHGLK